ncbi:MAG: pinensin family lanthipeptide [Cyclobacteriaceae bacterium]
MKKAKIKLSELKVKSFTTDVKSEEVKGGRWSIGGAGACPHTGAPTLDALGCNSGDPFYCWNQSNGYNSLCDAVPAFTD